METIIEESNNNNVEFSKVNGITEIDLPLPPFVAVEVRNVDYRYVTNWLALDKLMTNPFSIGRDNPPVLQGISLRATKGKTYALLGASGCGKTTLLKCILGQLQPINGSISIFGQKPGSKHCPIPGPGVGYMPQECALFPELTIGETFRYFGKMYQLPDSVVSTRKKAIIELLQLPPSNRLIKTLSGGQQRRASLACALIHQPPLLILDEPTVGVDPLLRAAIWSHLEHLCRDFGLTVIMTTHYTEEARTADKIGFIRNGRLLVEAKPDALLAQYHHTRLEDVFLELCESQDRELKAKSKEVQDDLDLQQQPDTLPSGPNMLQTLLHLDTGFNFRRFHALFIKNSLTFRRNLPVTLFYCLLPALQFSLFMVSTGKAPSGIGIAVCNEESPVELTGNFLSRLDSTATRQIVVNSSEEVQQAVANGKAWIGMHFWANYTSTLDERRTEFMHADESTLNASSMHLYLDHTNAILGAFVFYNIMIAFYGTMSEYLHSVGSNIDSFSIPLGIKEVIYGSLDLNSASMTEFISPGVIILIAFFSTAAVAGLAFILEQKDGLMARSRVAGVRPLESIAAHISTQTVVLTVQQVLFFATMFFLWGVPSRGPLIHVFIICFLQGVAGIMYGLFIASLFPDQVNAAIVTLGSFLPMFMCSGLMWPIKSVSILAHYISLVLPQTLAMNAIRNVISRGWSLEHTEVVLGLGASGAWVLIFMFMAMFTFGKFH